jgi:flagellar motor switch protein FliN/FliY
MALISRVPAFDVATAIARVLEAMFGHDVSLTAGPPAFGTPHPSALPEGPTRSVALPFSNGVVGVVTLVVAEQLATVMESLTPDASLEAAAVPALEAAAATIASVIDITVNLDWAGEIATDTLLTAVDGDFAAVPILENDVRIACVVVRVVEDLPAPAGMPAAPAPMPAMPEYTTTPVVSTIPAPVGAAAPGVTVHEFQAFADGQTAPGHIRSLTLLNDVNLEVTAELGRRRLKVRDIMALAPGSVIELDKTAGSPVDVLVNGSIVWHGEVVVVDDEFGIRVSEIIVDGI